MNLRHVSRFLSSLLAQAAAFCLMTAAFTPVLHAQQLVASSSSLPDAPAPVIQPKSAEAAAVIPTHRVETPQIGDQHKFWDRENSVLFIASAALNGADFAATRANLQSGGQELNPVVRIFGRSSAGLAVNFAGETVGVVGLSYFFHKTGHHKLERAVSLVNIGSSAGAVSYDVAHR